MQVTLMVVDCSKVQPTKTYNENPEILRFFRDVYGRWRPHTTLPIKE